ncbi:MAG: DUF87 domain-containing protein [Myxococcota bacterium]
MNDTATIALAEKADGGKVTVSLDRLRRHTLISGVTGMGKSRFLEHLLFELLRLRREGCKLGIGLIDPVGEVFDATKAYLASLCLRYRAAELGSPPALAARIQSKREALTRSLALIDFTDEHCGGWRLNPLERRAGFSTGETVGELLRVMERVLGSMTEMRRLQALLRSVLSVLVETEGATLRDAVDLLVADSESLVEFIDELERRRQQGTLRLPLRRSIVEIYFRDLFLTTSRRERRELIASTMHALNVFLADERAATFLGAPRGNLDLEAIVSSGGALLVKLPASLDLNTQKVLGTLLVSRIELLARRRKVPDVKAGREPLFALMVDEFQDFVGPHWAQTFAQLRNYGLMMVVSHQTRAQLESSDEMKALYRAVSANTELKVHFRQPLDPDALAAAPMIFRPEGRRLRRIAVDRSRSRSQTRSLQRAQSRSLSVSLSHGLSHSITHTFSVGQGQSVSFSSSEGRTQVETESLSISTGENWSSVINKSTGLSVTQSASQTQVRGGSLAMGQAKSRGQSHSSSSSHGQSWGQFEGEGLSLAVGYDPALGAALARDHRSSSQGASRGHSSTQSTSLARSFGQAVSQVISQAQSLAEGQSLGQARSNSEGLSLGRGGSRSRSQGHSLAQGISLVESCMQGFSRSFTQAQARGLTEQVSRSRSQGLSVTRTVSEGDSTAEGHTEREELYSVAEEVQLRAYELSCLPPRQAWVLLGAGEAHKIRTLEVPDHFPCRWGPLDGQQLLECSTAPPPSPPESRFPLLERERRRRPVGHGDP